MVLAVNGKLAKSAYAVPLPSAAVFQPLKLEFVKVNVFAVSGVAAEADWFAIEPVPPLGLKVTAVW